MLCILCALASCCALPLTILRLATNNTAPCPPRPLRKRDCAMTGGNKHKETALRAPSNSKDTCPENYIHLAQTISTKNMNAMHTVRFS